MNNAKEKKKQQKHTKRHTCKEMHKRKRENEGVHLTTRVKKWHFITFCERLKIFLLQIQYHQKMKNVYCSM